MPVFAGAAIQSNTISIETIILSAIAGFVSYILIITSRKYKILKQQNASYEMYYKKETMLKIITSTVIIGTVLFFLAKYL